MGDPGGTVAGFLQLTHGEEFAISADGCAGLLLEIVPLIMRAVRSIHIEQAIDLTVGQFRTLLFVQRHKGASLSEASEFLGLTLPSASKLVDQLVKRGFLDRENDPEDRRRMVLRLTARGNALLKDAHTAVRAQLAEVLKGLSGAELDTLHDTLVLLQRSFPEIPAGFAPTDTHASSASRKS